MFISIRNQKHPRQLTEQALLWNISGSLLGIHLNPDAWNPALKIYPSVGPSPKKCFFPCFSNTEEYVRAAEVLIRPCNLHLPRILFSRRETAAPVTAYQCLLWNHGDKKDTLMFKSC